MQTLTACVARKRLPVYAQPFGDRSPIVTYAPIGSAPPSSLPIWTAGNLGSINTGAIQIGTFCAMVWMFFLRSVLLAGGGPACHLLPGAALRPRP
jgi:hypothetical protein